MTVFPLVNRQTVSTPPLYPERIVQFGAGNFLRGFTDWIIQTLNEQTNFASGVVVVKVTPGTYPELEAQDGLFHVTLEGLRNGVFHSETRRIDCLQRFVYPYVDFESYCALARQPEVRFLISNTTETGIRYHAEDRLTDTPATSFPAKLTQFLYERFQHFEGDSARGCIIIPTELIVHNGDELRRIVLLYATQWELPHAFVAWVTEANLFCNTLVDRIVSGAPTAEQAQTLTERIGLEDRQLVMAEWYHSWVIEAPARLHDELPVQGTGLGVQIVSDVEPYRQTKVRILNGLHTAMLPFACFMGIETVHEGMNHPTLSPWIATLAYQEIIPSMSLNQEELRLFASAVLERFNNPTLNHRFSSIALNTLAKARVRLVPSIQGYHAQQGTLPTRLVLALAAIIRFYQGTWNGQPLPIQDEAWVVEWFAQLWQASMTPAERAQAVLGNETLWGENLLNVEGLPHALAEALARLEDEPLLTLL
ncbi:MAG: tagaturonate reductase [Phototrophicaceae bacterium]